jgi:RHS repeat-associated protein
MDSSGDFDFSDRDQTGEQLTTHGITLSAQYTPWFDSWNLGTVRNVWEAKLNRTQGYAFSQVTGSCGWTWTNPQQQQQAFKCPFYPEFAMQRPDGYSMVGGYVQGARVYDPTSGQWLTPDPYAGDVHDPMSQKPFMWNDNNPVEWSDPSGYCAWDLCVVEGIAVGELITAISALAIIAAGDELSKHVHESRGSLIPLRGAPESQIRRGDTVVVYGPNGDAVKRIDIGGRSHGGVDPPHVQDYKTNRNPVTGKSYVQPDGKVRSATPEEAQQADNAPPGESSLPGQNPRGGQPGDSKNSSSQQPP